MTRPNGKKIIGIMIGDPCGVGPEVIVKALKNTELRQSFVPVLIGSTYSVERACALTETDLDIKKIDLTACSSRDFKDEDRVYVHDMANLDERKIVYGQVVPECGLAVSEWLQEMEKLALEKKISAAVMGPINTESIKAAHAEGVLPKIEPGGAYNFLVSGPLRIIHLTDHVLIRDVPAMITENNISHAVRHIAAMFSMSGIVNPRIMVAGLNPHAAGPEDRVINVAVEKLRSESIDVIGPCSPDSVFRWCLEKKCDAVLAMYHDQGHIALKTWGFSGNFAMILGFPYLFISVAHGTAFDIAGLGRADEKMMVSALNNVVSLSNGGGFIE